MNSWEKSKVFKQRYTIFGSEPLSAMLLAAGRISWESTAVSCLVSMPFLGVCTQVLLLLFLPLRGGLMSLRNLKTVLKLLGMRDLGCHL